MSLQVLVVVSSLRDNGGLRVALDDARRWRAAGATVELAVVQHADDGPLADPDPSLLTVFLTAPGTRARYTMPIALARLVRRARRADVVVAGAEEGNGLLLGFAAARATRRPVAVLAQGRLEASIPDWVPRPLQGVTWWIHRHVDASVCVADNIRDSVVANGLAPERAEVVPHGIDVDALRERVAGETRAPGAPVVVGCGRLAPVKNFALLLRAHARLVADGVDHRLRIVGVGPSRDALDRLVGELEVADTATLTGFVDDSAVELARAALFVLSSDSEGAPLVLMEALALGLPVVATRCSETVEEIVAGADGTLVDVGADDQLADAISARLRRDAGPRPVADGPAVRDAAQAAARVLALLHDLVGRAGRGRAGACPPAAPPASASTATPARRPGR